MHHMINGIFLDPNRIRMTPFMQYVRSDDYSHKKRCEEELDATRQNSELKKEYDKVMNELKMYKQEYIDAKKAYEEKKANKR